ncbi:MAG TPA: glucoamylase family protein, partial [Lysobacter sp.]|nr:glucoamylase family protein [Lysobacter sp.]
LLGACGKTGQAPSPAVADAQQADQATTDGADGIALPASDEEFLDLVQERTFRWFWEATPANGLTPDRWPSKTMSSIAAVGFALSAWPVGVERGWVTREQARERTLVTLRHFRDAPQGPEPTGRIGHHGFFYHFLDGETGLRFDNSELSSIDTTLLLGGVLLAQAYYDGDHKDEVAIRQLADSIYRRVDWTFFRPDPPLVTMGWRPGEGFGRAKWKGYDESLLLQVLALGSPTHALTPDLYTTYVSTYEWADFQGQQHVNFAPLFGHQYSHVWIDFRGIRDDFMRKHDLDYFENSRRATLSQRAYAIENPMGWHGYDKDAWGLTASDGPGGFKLTIDGVEREFRSYWARGAAHGDIRDDGTLVPTAAGGSVPFAPEVTIPALRAMAERYGEHLFTKYGYVDAFNPTLRDGSIQPKRGKIVPGVGWFNDDYLGIDQGPILLMIENHRSGMIWELMKKSEPIARGLCRAGYRGGWLEGRCE